jgi:hypothetical protein
VLNSFLLDGKRQFVMHGGKRRVYQRRLSLHGTTS